MNMRVLNVEASFSLVCIDILLEVGAWTHVGAGGVNVALHAL